MPSPTQDPCHLILVEGYTEDIFFNIAKKLFFKNKPCIIKNLKGNFNVNKKILDIATNYLTDHPTRSFAISINIDRDSRSEKAPIDLEYIIKELEPYSNIKQENIRLFDATQDIESWFFYDIDGIYKFLKIPVSKRKPKKYKLVEMFNHNDLSKLFESAGKIYKKGNASKNFIEHLNFQKIKSKCSTFSSFCDYINKIK